MARKNPFVIVFVCLISSLLLLSACSDPDPSSAEAKAEKKEENKFEKLAKEKNKERVLEPLELTS